MGKLHLFKCVCVSFVKRLEAGLVRLGRRLVFLKLGLELIDTLPGSTELFFSHFPLSRVPCKSVTVRNMTFFQGIDVLEMILNHDRLIINHSFMIINLSL